MSKSIHPNSNIPFETESGTALPLHGVRVLDATYNLAGPFGGAILADLGADVIKIETLTGDPTRAMASVDGDRSAYFHVVNRNKSAVSIDLKSSIDRVKLDARLDECDIFLTNFLPTRLEALHLTAAELMAKRPQLIFGNLSSYGAEGPDAATPGYDATVQARTGIMHVTGEADGTLVRVGVSVLDVGSDNIFTKLCPLIDRKDLTTDPRFTTNTDRVTNAQDLKIEIEKALIGENAIYWAQILGGGGVPPDRVALPEDLRNDQQARATRILLPYPDDSTALSELPGLPLRINGMPPPIRMAAPHLES